MRFNVVDDSGTVSFVAPCHALKMFTAACAKNPASLGELLELVGRYDPQLPQYVLSSLAVFDEHNSAENAEAIHAALASLPPERSPAFRIIDAKTREASLLPVKAGLVIFNLTAKRIIQVQNGYAEVKRQDRGRVRGEDGDATDRLYYYRLPKDWALLP